MVHVTLFFRWCPFSGKHNFLVEDVAKAAPYEWTQLAGKVVFHLVFTGSSTETIVVLTKPDGPLGENFALWQVMKWGLAYSGH